MGAAAPSFQREAAGRLGSVAFNEGDPLWAAIFCTAVLGIIALGLIGALERVLLKWHSSQRPTQERATRSARDVVGYGPPR